MKRCAVLAATLMLLGCDNGPAGPSAAHPALTATIASTHYVIRVAPGDTVDAVWQDQYYDWLLGALQLQPGTRLEYHKYKDRDHLEAITGRETNGFAEPGTPKFHTIWPIDNHEGVHAIAILQIGHPPALFNEGLAVAHHMDPPRGILTPRWNGVDLHTLAREHDRAGRLPSLASLTASRTFFDHDTNITYPCAGSFVRYLIDTHGLAPLKQYISSSTFDDAAAVTEARVRSAYGRTLAELWSEWRAAIR